MSLLYDDTQLLLAVDLREVEANLDGALSDLSATVVTQLALKAKAQAYQSRIDRGLASAANMGARLDELAEAAGMSHDEVIDRLLSTPEGLMAASTRLRLGLDRPAKRPALALVRAAAATPDEATPNAAEQVVVAAEEAAIDPISTDPRPRKRTWWSR